MNLKPNCNREDIKSGSVIGFAVFRDFSQSRTRAAAEATLGKL